MKVLFAVSNENITNMIIKRYEKEYKEIISANRVYYFNAILKEIQKDKTYDRIVISEDLEPFANSNYEQIDKFIFEKLDNISDEAQDIDGNETSIILICSDRRQPGSSFLVKIFSIGIYNALLGTDRKIESVCKLINRPRVKKEAKMYYKIDSDDASYSNKAEKEVSELEITNILTHFKKLGRNTDKYADSFNNIAAQYTDDQLKIIINCLPMNVKAQLEEDSQKYQELMSSEGMITRVNREAIKTKEAEQQTGIKIDIIDSQERQKMSGPIVIPSSVRTSKNKGPDPVRPQGNPVQTYDGNQANAAPQQPAPQQPAPQQPAAAPQAGGNALDNMKAQPEQTKKPSVFDRFKNKKNDAAPGATPEEQPKKAKLPFNPLDNGADRRGRPKKGEEKQKAPEAPVEESNEDLSDMILPGMEAFTDAPAAEPPAEEEFDVLGTNNPPAPVDELSEDMLPGMDDFDLGDDGFEAPTMDDFDDDLPGLDDDITGPGTDVVPPKPTAAAAADDDDALPGMDDFDMGLTDDAPTEEIEEDMLPGMDDDLTGLDDDITGPGTDVVPPRPAAPATPVVEEDDALPGMDDFDMELTDDAPATGTPEDSLPGMDDDVEIPGMDDDLDMAITDDTASDDMVPSIGDDLEMAITDDTASDDSLPGMDDDLDITMTDDTAADELPGMDEIPAETVAQVAEQPVPEAPASDDFDDEELTDEVELPGLDELDDFDESAEIPGMDDFDMGMTDDISPDDALPNIESTEAEDTLLGGFEEDATVEEPVQETVSEPQQPQQSQQLESIKSTVDYSMSSLNSLLTKDKKIVSFVGPSKSGTSFLVNNLATLISEVGINTAILDLTRNKDSYYIFTMNEEPLRKVAYNSIQKLQKGFAEGIKVNKNLTVYTALPNGDSDYSDAEAILSTLVQNHSLVLLDCDFNTDPSYFAMCQEMYIVQTMDILTIQPLTAFLRDLKSKDILETEKLRIVINKETKLRNLSTKQVIDGLCFYNDPSMSFMTELFNKDLVRKICTLPLDMTAYVAYLEALPICRISINKYSKQFMVKLKVLQDMVYPLVGKSTAGSRGPMDRQQVDYGKKEFSSSMNNTLNQMKKKNF